MKKTRGFSYIEVIIALALFAIALLAIIPALSQAGRNMMLAEESYMGHLQAQRIMLVVRDSMADGASSSAVRATALDYAAGDFEFSLWVFGRGQQHFHTIDEPDIDVAISGLNPAMTSQASTIIAVVWGENGQIAGRAIGILNR